MELKLYNEDCLEAMKRLEDKSIDMILCDYTKMTYDEILKDPSDKEKILQYLYDIEKMFVEDDYDSGWNSALFAIEGFIENKL